MARIVIHERSSPYILDKAQLEGDKIWICACGLTATPPFCDDSHKGTRGETPGALVYYPGNDDARAPVPIDPAVLGGQPEEAKRVRTRAVE